MSGTIILPSNDRLDTSRVTAPDGSVRHRENMVIAGTVFSQVANVVNTQPANTDYGLPVWVVGHHPDSASAAHQVTQNTHLSNLRTDVQNVQAAILGTPAVKFASAQAVTVSSLPNVTFSGQQPVHGTVVIANTPIPISTVAGTVNVAFTPTSNQSVTVTTAAAGGTVLALFSEQQTQTTSLSNINTNVQSVQAAILGTPAVKFATSQQVNITNTPAVTFSGQQPIHGTVQIGGIPSVNINNTPIPISTVAGTVQVAFTPSSTQSVSMVTAAAGGTVLARYDEQQTQTTSLNNINTNVQAVQAAVLGTPAVKFASAQSVTISNTPSVTFSGQQPIHGTVALYGTPSVAISTMPPISVNSGTISYILNERLDIALRNMGVPGTPVRIDPTGTTTQPVNLVGGAGTVAINSIPSVTVDSLPNIVFSGQQPIHGTIIVNNTINANITNTPAVTLSGQQPVHGTVIVNNTVTTTVSNTPSVTVTNNEFPVRLQNYGHSGTPLRVDPTGTTIQPVSIASAAPISTIAGTVAVNVRNNIFTHKTARVEVGGAGNYTIVSAVTGKRIKVYGANVQAERGGTVPVTWMDGTAPMAGTQTYVDREGFVMVVNPPSFIFAPQPGTALVAHVGTILNSGGGFRGWVSYWDNDIE